MSTSTYSQESQRLLSPLLSPEEPSSEQTMSRFVPGLKTKTRLIFHTVRSLNIGVFITALALLIYSSVLPFCPLLKSKSYISRSIFVNQDQRPTIAVSSRSISQLAYASKPSKSSYVFIRKDASAKDGPHGLYTPIWLSSRSVD